VAEKEAKPDFQAEQVTQSTSSSVAATLSQGIIDGFTNYRRQSVGGIPSIVCTTRITDQYFLHKAIEAVRKEG